MTKVSISLQTKITQLIRRFSEILSDAFEAANQGKVTTLVMLDLSASFDCVDHVILLSRLDRRIWFRSKALEWIKSYLMNRVSRVLYNRVLSRSLRMQYGVPQGSILGTLLFVMFLNELEDVVLRHQLKMHFYADNVQVYNSHQLDRLAEVESSLSSCIRDVENWLLRNKLKLNPSITELMFFGTKKQLSKYTFSSMKLGKNVIQRSNVVKNLGVLLDKNLSKTNHINKVASQSFYELPQIGTVISSLSGEAATALVHSFIGTRLDYCNNNSIVIVTLL